MTDDQLYRLLPTVHRLRDAKNGYPLRTLITAIAEQYDQLDDDIAALYANWFIETCDAHTIPQFAALLGVALDPGRGGVAVDPELDRARIGNSITDRRRKGTVAAIEDVGHEVTGWPVRVVESGLHESSIHSVRFAEAHHSQLMDVRAAEPTSQVHNPFSKAARLPDVRAVDSHRTAGSGNVGSVLVSLWRLRPDVAANVPAARIARRRYTFDPLGADRHLAVLPTTRRPGAEPVSDLDVPAPLHRLPVAANPADYFGPGRSISITVDDTPVPQTRLVIGNLAAWRFDHENHRVCVDPVLGRLMLSRDYGGEHHHEHRVRVSYATLAVGGIGADHDVVPTARRHAHRYRVSAHGQGDHRSITEALTTWYADRENGAGAHDIVIEILDNDVYRESPLIELYADERLTICAAAGKRPAVLGADDNGEHEGRAHPEHSSHREGSAYHEESAHREGSAVIRVRGHRRRRNGDAGDDPGRLPSILLEGLYLGQPIVVEQRLATARLRRCTLVPHRAGEREYQPSIVVTSWTTELRLEACISGPISIDTGQTGRDPSFIEVRDSILDAGKASRQILQGRERRPAFASLDILRSTVLGALHLSAMSLCKNTIVTGRVEVEYRQRGHVEYSYLPAQSRTPVRTHCQPDDALAWLEERTTGPLSDQQRHGVELELAPRFDSTRFGNPEYGRLTTDGAPQLTTGATDGGELGAFHDLWGARRLESLQRRLNELVPPGVDIAARLQT